jgi:hypothetical protein
MNDILSLKRLYLLVRVDTLMQKRAVMLILSVIFGGLLLLALLSPDLTVGMFAEPTLFLVILFISGFWISSKAFHVLHTGQLARNYLLLPATQLEKFISRLFLTSIGLAVLGVTIYFFLSLLISGLVWVFYRASVPLFVFTSAKLWHGITTYCILQAVVLLASIYFRNHCLLKLLLTLVIIKLSIFFLTILISGIFLNHTITDSPFAISQMMFIFTPAKYFGEELISRIFWLGLAPFCWWVSYVRLKESEEVHGI